MADLNRIPGTKRLIDLTYGRLRRLEIWRAWWPFLAFVTLFLIAAISGAFERAPSGLAAIATLVFFVGALITGWRGFSRYQSPSRKEAIFALDQQSDLRPLASLADRPARPEIQGVRLWRAHEERLTDAVRRLKVPDFNSVWPKLDPLRLRIILPLAFAAVLALNFNQAT
ncbi:MAG: DUF4175 family protein, partial [Pseudomonadota bacterium]